MEDLIVRGRRFARVACSSAVLPLNRRLLGLCAVAAALLTNAPAQSQGTGTITGHVLDSATGKYLEGADLTVTGTNLHTTSERGGAFALIGVPVGDQQVSASYPGLNPLTVAVTVAADRAASVDVNFNADVVKLEAFHVAGMKEGSAQAIALQKAAVNMKVVAAGDQYGDIAEGNAAEYLKFLPGVGVDYNANDARAVTLRGMNTQFTSVTLNGSPVASATSGNLNRRFEMEQLSISNVETIEVFKTLTPETPATSTGGAINMITKSAFDRSGDLFTYRLYLQAISTELSFGRSPGWGQELSRKITPGIDLNYAKHLTKNLGLNISYKLSELVNDYPRSSYAWEYNPANGGTPKNPILTSWNLQNEQKITKRQGASAQLDYKLGDSTRLTFLADWTYYNLYFTDRTLTVNTGTLAPLATTSTANPFATTAGLAAKGSVTLQQIFRNKSGVTWHVPFNLTHDFADGSKLDLTAYWSQAYSHYRDTTGGFYSDITMQRGGTSPQTNTVADPLTVAFSNIGAVVPTYTITDAGGPASLQNASLFQVSQIRSRPQTGLDTKDGGGVSYLKNFKTRLPISVKVGVSNDDTTRNIVDPIFNRTGTTAATGFGGTSAVTGSVLAGMTDTVFAAHPIGYGLPAFSFPSVYKSFAQLGGLAYLPYTPAADIRARFEDTTKAYYGRFDITPMENVLVVAGVRYEDRLTHSTNSLLTLATPAVGTFADKSWSPSVNVKYTPVKDLVIRLGYSKSIGLPDYSDLLPGPAVITDPVGTTRGKISVYNSALKPYHTDNLDAGVSYYFSNTSVVSLSVFQKKLTNYIITGTAALDAPTAAVLGLTNTLGFSPDQYDITTKFNVADPGYYRGLEVAYAQNFAILPKPFGTLNLQVNGTLLDIKKIKTSQVFSTTDAPLNAAIQEQIGLNLALASVKQALNVSLSTTFGKFAFNIQSNYAGRQLKALSQKTVKYSDVAANQYFNEQQYQAAREVVDVRVDYKWSRRFTPYFQVRNILGRPIIFETANLPLNHAEYGDPIYELGVRGAW
jgi:iron complex outermembrane receptor protein